MDIWEWTRKKREETRESLAKKPIKPNLIPELLEEIETLMFQAYQIGQGKTGE